MGSISWGKELVPSGRVHELFSSVLRSVRDRDPVCSHSDQYSSPRQGYSARVSRLTCHQHCMEAGSTEVTMASISRLTRGPGFPKGLQEYKVLYTGEGESEGSESIPSTQKQLACCIHPTHPWTPLHSIRQHAQQWLLPLAHHSGIYYLSNPSIPVPFLFHSLITSSSS